MTVDDREPPTSPGERPVTGVEDGLAALLASRDEFGHEPEPRPDLPPTGLAALAATSRPARAPRPARASRPARATSPTRSSGAARPRQAPPPSTPFWRFGFPVLVLALAGLAAGLFVVGSRAVLDSKGGTLPGGPQDPSEPGWEASTLPTPTLLVVSADDANAATGFALLSLGGEKNGGVIVMPPSTALAIPGFAPLRLDEIYAQHGSSDVKVTVELLLGVGINDVVVVDSGSWEALAAPAAPITVENPDPVRVDGRTEFPSGTVELGAADVGRFLAGSSDAESDVNRLLRLVNFWRAWLDDVKSSGTADDLPGESQTGIGRFVRGLATRTVDVAELPGQPGAGPPPAFFAAADGTATLVARLIPFPVSPAPSVRPRLRVLDGTGDFDHGVSLTPLLVQAGCEIAKIGNAPTFGRTVTELTYYDDTMRDKVQRIRDVLGVGELVKAPTPGQGDDVTIVLGADAKAAVERAGQTVLTTPPSVVGTSIIGGTSG